MEPPDAELEGNLPDPAGPEFPVPDLLLGLFDGFSFVPPSPIAWRNSEEFYPKLSLILSSEPLLFGPPANS